MEPSEQQRRYARFWKKFWLLTRGRLDVLRAMDVIVEEEADPQFREVLARVRSTLREGEPLSEALNLQPDVFSRAVRELVRSAERTGAWDEILPLVAEGLSDGTFN